MAKIDTEFDFSETFSFKIGRPYRRIVYAELKNRSRTRFTAYLNFPSRPLRFLIAGSNRRSPRSGILGVRNGNEGELMLLGEGVVDNDAFGSAVKKGFCDDFAIGNTADEFGVKDEGASLTISCD